MTSGGHGGFHMSVMLASGSWGSGPYKASRAEGLYLLRWVWAYGGEWKRLDPAPRTRSQLLDQDLLVSPP